MAEDPLTVGGTEHPVHAQELMDAAHAGRAEMDSRCGDAINAGPESGGGADDVPVNDTPPPPTWRDYPQQ